MSAVERPWTPLGYTSTHYYVLAAIGHVVGIPLTCLDRLGILRIAPLTWWQNLHGGPGEPVRWSEARDEIVRACHLQGQASADIVVGAIHLDSEELRADSLPSRDHPSLAEMKALLARIRRYFHTKITECSITRCHVQVTGRDSRSQDAGDNVDGAEVVGVHTISSPGDQEMQSLSAERSPSIGKLGRAAMRDEEGEPVGSGQRLTRALMHYDETPARPEPNARIIEQLQGELGSLRRLAERAEARTGWWRAAAILAGTVLGMALVGKALQGWLS